MEFSYNKVVPSTTRMSPFKVVYDFNPLTPLDLLPFPDIDSMTNKDGLVKATFVRNLHKEVKAQTEKNMEKLAFKANQGRKKIKFEPDKYGCGFTLGFTLGRRGFHLKGNVNFYQKEMDHFKFLKESMTMLTLLIYLKIIGVSSSFNINDLSPFDGGSNLGRTIPEFHIRRT